MFSAYHGYPYPALPWIKRFFLPLLMCASAAANAASRQLGEMPVPVLTGVQVQAGVTFDATARRYTYSYAVSNPGTNTGKIWNVALDMTSRAARLPFGSAGLRIEFMTGKFKSFDQEWADLHVQRMLPAGTVVIPFGQHIPQGWMGGMRQDGFASFSGDENSSLISPGSSLAGFELISEGVPTLRAMEIEPDWQFISDEEATEEEEQIFAEIEKSILFHTQTLGPSGVFPGTYDHWNQLRDDLNKAMQLGWLPDQAFAATLVNQLASARQAVAADGTLAKQRLQTLLTTLAQSTSSQRRPEIRDLVYWNVQAIIANTPDTPIPLDPFEPKVTLTPPAQTLPLGATYTLTATVINAATGKPIPDFSLSFVVIDGPHAGLEMRKVADAAGKASFSYTGTSLGRDRIWLGEDGEVRTEFGQAGVTWEGGPDLVIEL
ncbi:MAG: hypothetical protein ACOY4D_06020, partial [Pseudomonadota bacterium]